MVNEDLIDFLYCCLAGLLAAPGLVAFFLADDIFKFMEVCMRRLAGKYDKKIFGYTARRVRSVNLSDVVRRGGIRL